MGEGREDAQDASLEASNAAEGQTVAEASNVSENGKNESLTQQSEMTGTKQKIVSVSLIGTDSEKKGTHTLFFGGNAVTFEDGGAQLPKDVADSLKKAGHVE